MEDKQVGEFWKEPCTHCIGSCTQCNKLRSVIRKLVNERAKAYKLCDMAVLRTKGNEVYIAMGCRDFGIDPATWPQEKK